MIEFEKISGMRLIQQYLQKCVKRVSKSLIKSYIKSCTQLGKKGSNNKQQKGITRSAPTSNCKTQIAKPCGKNESKLVKIGKKLVSVKANLKKTNSFKHPVVQLTSFFVDLLEAKQF